MPFNVKQLAAIIEEYPHLAVPLLGAVAGGTTGGVFSEEGASAKGALRGAILGAVTGGVAGLGAYGARSLAERFAPGSAARAGSILGGAAGGLFGQSKASPWTLELMKIEQEEKKRKIRKREEEAMGAEKRGEHVKEAADRLAAFDFGIDAWCDKNHVDKGAFAKEAGVTEKEFPAALKSWFEDVKAAHADAE